VKWGGWSLQTRKELTRRFTGTLPRQRSLSHGSAPALAAQNTLPRRKIRNLRDAPPEEMLHSSIGRWVRQPTRHSVKHSNGAGHLKTARGKGANRREEVRIHTDTPGSTLDLDTTRYETKILGNLKKCREEVLRCTQFQCNNEGVRWKERQGITLRLMKGR
jgi:hypothetical protein